MTEETGRSFKRFIGVNLGGGRGKTTAVARLERAGRGVNLVEARMRHGHRGGGEDSHDDSGDPLFRDEGRWSPICCATSTTRPWSRSTRR